MQEEWIGVSQAVKLTGKSGSTIRRWCDARLIKNRKRKDGRKILKQSLLTYLATECSMPIPRKKDETSHVEEAPSRDSHKVCHERLSEKNERILELKNEIKELKETNKMLHSELIKGSCELRAILAQQTGTHPSTWTRDPRRGATKKANY